MRTTYLFLLIILGLFLAGCTTGNVIAETDDSEYEKIPLSEITSSMKKHTFNANGVNVKYFVVLGRDEKVRTAFDACDVCGGYKGYVQKGTDVVCKNCGRVFRIDDIGSLNGPGGCWPSFLDHKIERDYVLISKSELARGAFRFR